MTAIARWKDLVLDASDASVALEFWSSVLGLVPEQDAEGGDGVMRGAQPGQTLWVNAVPEPKTTKNRVHLDLVRDDLDRLVDLGARVTMTPDQTGGSWSVLVDPEGNEFCVFPEEPGEPSALVIDSHDPARIAAWWADVYGARLLTPPDGVPRWVRGVEGLPFDVIKFVGVPEGKTVKNRMHWDVVGETAALLERGATLVRRRDDDIRWDVLADPEGNEFCAFRDE
jgi:predicted enzyme related to lactoylglutathione lyase